MEAAISIAVAFVGTLLLGLFMAAILQLVVPVWALLPVVVGFVVFVAIIGAG